MPDQATLPKLALAAALCLALAGCASPDLPPAPPEPPPAPLPPPPVELSMAPEEVAFRAAAEAARNRGLPILIERRSYLGDSFNVVFYNVSGREFRDIDFEVVPYDTRGRMAGRPEVLRFTGPVRNSLSLSNGLREGTQTEIWNGEDISCVEITGLELTFMDGERRRYSFDTVSSMYRDGVEKWCRFAS